MTSRTSGGSLSGLAPHERDLRLADYCMFFD